jgi:hypothetical protein
VVWCGVVWCGVVWCGVVWCGVVWCGVVWCVLELFLKGMYVMYLCLEYLYTRVLRHIRYTLYLITMMTHKEFLRMVFLVA